jgi:hypothetical protein
MRIPIIMLVVIAVLVGWQVRKIRARRRLREIDEGQRCLACDGTIMQRAGDHVRCQRCGHVASLASLRASVVRDDEISNITAP